MPAFSPAGGADQRSVPAMAADPRRTDRVLERRTVVENDGADTAEGAGTVVAVRGTIRGAPFDAGSTRSSQGTLRGWPTSPQVARPGILSQMIKPVRTIDEVSYRAANTGTRKRFPAP